MKTGVNVLQDRSDYIF